MVAMAVGVDDLLLLLQLVMNRALRIFTIFEAKSTCRGRRQVRIMVTTIAAASYRSVATSTSR